MEESKDQQFQRLLQFYGIDAATRARLKKLWPTISEMLPNVLDTFYKNVEDDPNIGHLVSNHTERLKLAQSSHWKLLFSGEFDQSYFDNIERIGRAHARIGLTTEWYIGGYSFILGELTRHLGKKARWRAGALAQDIAAVQRAATLDMCFAANAYQTIMVEEQQKKDRQIHTAIEEFRTQVEQQTHLATELGQKLVNSADEMEQLAEQNKSTAISANNTATATAQNVQSGAASVEEMSASVSEIGQQVNKSAATARSVAEDAERTNKNLADLQAATDEIGAVTDLIRDIAEQTNLLALNATIEAARAGEAGRGFAIVAAEVKDLAGQTSKATEDIGVKIAAIQAETIRCVQEIASIAAKISEVSQTTTSIASAVEEQDAATLEIAKSVQSAAENAAQTNNEISEILAQVNNAHQAITNTASTSRKMEEENGRLGAGIHAFFDEIRRIQA
ncbi:globin-coupled sensor protein [Rhodobacteraceae bacterium RKSG542]|uniref:globin-coupled sensor protein n=1 Tax=Pseudovibrio flavus TaxID=2529854 RepID=UPI0012BC8A35|nr:globin-coupled sensor protein [Pseudovibrio flavus]MTI19076.1 globin-coupled sensor protein [Pseudovibrio flavus]